jgi:tetratricopeptide (TPR) repeat protein
MNRQKEGAMGRKRFSIQLIIIVTVVFVLVGGMALNVMATTEEGWKLLSTGEFGKAEAIFEEILKGDAENTQAAYYLGLSLLMQEKYNEALNVFQNLKAALINKAVAGNAGTPNAGQVDIGLVRSYLGLKNYPEALKNLKAAEKAKADPVDLQTYNGAYYLEINENDTAKEALDKAIGLNSQNPYTYYYAGIASIRLGNPQKAVDMLKVFLEMAPYAPEAEHAKFLIDTLC